MGVNWPAKFKVAVTGLGKQPVALIMSLNFLDRHESLQRAISTRRLDLFEAVSIGILNIGDVY